MERYNRVRVIGSGTFGNVWLVQSQLSRHSYVLKEINLNSLNKEDQRQALNEADVLSRMKHLNIIRYKEAWIAKNSLKIVMEYADGGDLHSAIFNQNGIPFTEHRILTWFIQICLALQYIHFKNIIHRDLKSQNIFLSRNKVIKIGDFGIARFLLGPEELAKTAIGTPYYLSPEIFERKLYNHKSDIWALGCVLFEMTSLEHAFKANDFFQLAYLVLNGKRRDLPRSCSPIIEELVERLLKVHPDERPCTVEILENPALQPYLSEYMASQSSSDNYLPHLTGACKIKSRCICPNVKKELKRLSSGSELKFSANTDPMERRNSVSSIKIPKCTYVMKKEVKKPSPANVNRATLKKKSQKPSCPDKGQKHKVERNAKNETFAFQTDEAEKSGFIESCDTYVLPSSNLKNVNESKLSKSDDSLNKFYKCTYETALEGLSKAQIGDGSSYYNNSYCKTSTKLASGDGNMTQSTSSTLTTDVDDVFAFSETVRDFNKISFEFPVPSHCTHSQCHQCMLDTLWKNRIRSSVGGSVNKNEYSRLKSKLLTVFKEDLFRKVHRSLIYDWDGKEDAISKNKFQELMNSLNYDQVQSLPLMMQLIQLDLLMKPKK